MWWSELLSCGDISTVVPGVPPNAHSDAARRQAQWLTTLGDHLFVVGRVTLYRPMRVSVLPWHDPPIPVAEMKAAAAEIESLNVCPTDTQQRQARTLQPALAARYGVPVEIGEPAYTARDWQQRSRVACYHYDQLGLGAPTPPSA
jgi:hypothetical protein